ncbi:hypothetical protein AB0758_45355 [Tolypothrix bouteillei VB521301_2]|uniref:hypothetical protein n=1 Tax=Tolypothrix bouteillei TaxID=1246981 RepID=UPI0038B41C04
MVPTISSTSVWNLLQVSGEEMGTPTTIRAGCCCCNAMTAAHMVSNPSNFPTFKLGNHNSPTPPKEFCCYNCQEEIEAN